MAREFLRLPGQGLTNAQEEALKAICERFNAPYSPDDYLPAFDLPNGWVCGWVGGIAFQQTKRTIYIGVSPEGEIHS